MEVLLSIRYDSDPRFIRSCSGFILIQSLAENEKDANADEAMLMLFLQKQGFDFCQFGHRLELCFENLKEQGKILKSLQELANPEDKSLISKENFSCKLTLNLNHNNISLLSIADSELSSQRCVLV